MEVVYVAAYVHGYVLVLQQYGVERLLHVGALLLALGRLCVNRVVAYHYHPVFLGVCQRLVNPCKLLLYVLLAGVGIFFGVLAVLVYHWCGVYEYKAHGHAVVFQHFRVILGGHFPAAHLGVVDDGLRVSAVLVVAADGIPREHKLGVRVDKLVVGHPEGVLRARDALEVVYVACRRHALYAYGLGHAAHQFGYGFLVIVAVAAEVVGHVEVD